MVLVPQVRQAVSIPLIAAGGIATGRGMLAAFALGAEGIQMGTRFALARESSASEAFKELCIGLQEGDTMLALKKISPTRLIRNDFYRAVEEAESRGATADELKELLGRGRSKRGIFEGDLSDGELEIGQIASLIRRQPPPSSAKSSANTKRNACDSRHCRKFPVRGAEQERKRRERQTGCCPWFPRRVCTRGRGNARARRHAHG